MRGQARPMARLVQWMAQASPSIGTYLCSADGKNLNPANVTRELELQQLEYRSRTSNASGVKYGLCSYLTSLAPSMCVGWGRRSLRHAKWRQ